MNNNRLVVLILGVVSCTLVPLDASAQQVDPQEELQRAIAALDSTETERALVLFRELVTSGDEELPTSIAATAHAHMALAFWSLRQRDSARVHMATAVRTDPFYDLDDALNPDLLWAFHRTRQRTPAVGLRIPADTVLDPFLDSLPLMIAVGRPDAVVVQLRRLDSDGGDSLITTRSVSRVIIVPISLATGEALGLDRGDYRLTAEYSRPDQGRAESHVDMRIVQVGSDTVLHERPLGADVFRPEWKKSPVSVGSIVGGLIVGGAVAAIPYVAWSNELGDPESGGSVVIGGTIALAGVLGSVLGRDNVIDHQNIDFNQQMIHDWTQRNNATAVENQKRLRLGPLRIRVQNGR